MNRDKRGGRVEGVRKRRGGNRQMFSSSPTSSGDPLLFNAGTLRMSGGKTWHGERRERGRGRRERESIVGTCVKYDPLGRHVQECLIFNAYF